MMNERDVRGVFVPVVTPFLPNGELDLDSYGSYAGKLMEQGIQGTVINGTTGESPTVSWEEVELLVEVTKERMAGNRIPVIVGTGSNDTAASVKLTELAGNLEADAALVVVPYYNRPSQEGIIEHFRAVARVGVPVIVYEIPSRTGVTLTVDTARRIMELDGVIGLKDCSGGIGLVSELTRLGSKPVLCGEDEYFHAMLCAGASGGILASANVNTGTFIEVFRHAEAGKYMKAKRTFDSLLPLIRLLFRESNPAPLKWLLTYRGLIASETVRLPMSPITEGLKLELECLLARNFR
ncbi:4-hydroxy-tetrahydrodipicolinate synthase [Paenibacillus alkalitolerans]|uniref:4-hydroxy-tetrahydrodipicolinate synthase n=1 Tax=Paenibacillus alkalitolerans TaxID=2799335 RepID=UPI0018F69549|nr:4-hydroxy-tetrahydrodipicolinate synthase [Paenibacillus alkalitolerans]